MICLFCKASESQDSIEHLVCCPVILNCLPKRLVQSSLRERWLLVLLHSKKKEVNIEFACFVVALHSVHNELRHGASNAEIRLKIQRAVLHLNLKKHIRDIWKDFSENFRDHNKLLKG